MRREAFSFLAVALTASAQVAFVPAALAGPHDALIAKHAAANGVPEHLVRRVIRIESRGNAAAVHRGNYGLMQIRLGTARGVGYSGDAKGLLDPDTNLTYAVKYLAGAYRAAGCDADRAVSYYQRGYYGAAQRECGASPATVVQFAQAEIKPTRSPGVMLPPQRPNRISPRQSPRRDQAQGGPHRNHRGAEVGPRSGAAGREFRAGASCAAGQPVAIRSAGDKQHPWPACPSRRLAEPAAKVALAFVPLPPVRPELDATAEVARCLASVPLPPVRPEFDPAPKPIVQPIHRTERARKRADKKVNGCRAIRDGVEIQDRVEIQRSTIRPASFRF